jgi:hypothetical protein
MADDHLQGASRTYRLASVLPEASFGAVIQAWWRAADQGREDIVFQYLRAKGNDMTGRFSVLDATAANDAINVSFAAAGLVVLPGDVSLVGARAELTVAANILAFAERRAEIERTASINATELEVLHARLVKLRDLFLCDSAMVRLWWSNGEPDKMVRLAEHAASFDSLVSMVSGAHAEPAQVEPIATLVWQFLADLGPDHRTLLIGQLAKVFESYQQPGLAEELLKA